MLHTFKKDMGGFVDYYCNACGELHHDGKDLDENELPLALQRAYGTVWTDRFRAECYLVKYPGQFEGRYGVALVADFFADDYRDGTYRKVKGWALDTARALAVRYPKLEVVFGDDTQEWSPGLPSSELLLILPWNIGCRVFDDIAEHFDRATLYASCS